MTDVIDSPSTPSLSDLDSSLAGSASAPTPDEAAAAYPMMGTPAVLVRPSSADDVAAAVRYANAGSLPIAVRSGGHGHSSYGLYDDALVLDLADLNRITVEGDLVRIGGGATWGAVAQALKPHGLALTSGDTVSVGVGGLTLGGGIGWMVRGHGLAIDNLVEATVVTGDGRVVRAADDENPELLWALKGGGGNFGVVTEFAFRALPLDGVVAGTIVFDGSDLRGVLRGWRDVMRTAPEELNGTFIAFPSFGDQPPSFTLLTGYMGSDEEAARAALAPLLDLPGVVSSDLEPKAYADVLDDPHPPEAPVRPVGHNAFIADLSDDAIDGLARAYESVGGMLMLRWLSGAFNRVPADATAFAHRDAEVFLVFFAFVPLDADEAAVQVVHDAWRTLDRHVHGTYGNFVNEPDDVTTTLMYPESTLARLRQVKREWDPQNVFRRNHNVAPV